MSYFHPRYSRRAALAFALALGVGLHVVPTQAQQNTAKSALASSRLHTLAPPAASVAAAASVPSADSTKLAGRAPNSPAQAADPANTASAACSNPGPREAAGVVTETNAAHSAKASAWFRNVGEGETLWASSVGSVAAATATSSTLGGVRTA